MRGQVLKLQVRVEEAYDAGDVLPAVVQGICETTRNFAAFLISFQHGQQQRDHFVLHDTFEI